MSRMLFLRDIQVDIQMRCRSCGHEGVLARPDMERRFGPNYPVLSIGPHYRCSHCDSRNVESHPSPETRAPMAAPVMERTAGGEALGAFGGGLHALRDTGPQHIEADVRNLLGGGLLGALTEDQSDEEGPDEEEPDGELPDESPDERWRDAEDEFDRLLASLAPTPPHDEPAAEPPEALPVEAGPVEADPVEAGPVEASDGGNPPGEPEEETSADVLAALWALMDEPARPVVAEEPAVEEDAEADALEDDADAVAEDLDDIDDIPTEEIVSFAVRDRDFDFGEDDEEPEDEEPEDDGPEDDGPEDDGPEDDGPEDDEEPDYGDDVLDLGAAPEERGPDPVPAPAPSRQRPPQPGSLDESLAALRALVEKAAEEPEPEPRRPAPPPAEPVRAEKPPRAAIEPSGKNDPGEEGEPVIPYKTAQERSLEETLAQLRGMLDLDTGAEEGEPVVKPRRR